MSEDTDIRNDGIGDSVREHLGNGPMTFEDLYSKIDILENTNGQKRQARRGSTPIPPHAAPKADRDARIILETLLADAQHALDQYVYSVGDKRILDHLMAARDSARGAFRAYIGE